MQANSTAKCACRHCGGHLEFDTDSLGLEIACPHCAETTPLLPPAPPAAKPKRRRRWLRALLLLFVILLGPLLIGAFGLIGLTTIREVLNHPNATLAIGLVLVAVSALLVLSWVMLPLIIWTGLQRIEHRLAELAARKF